VGVPDYGASPAIAFQRTYEPKRREERRGNAAHTIVDIGIHLPFASQNGQVVLHPLELPLYSLGDFSLFIIATFIDLIREANLPRCWAVRAPWVH
jgi:hypothetical protein